MNFIHNKIGFLGSGFAAIFSILLFLFNFLFIGDTFAESIAWQRLDRGLYLGEFESPQKSIICNHKVVVLRVDPKFYSFQLLSASEKDKKIRTVKQWCQEFDLISVINASMYQRTYPLKSTGYMKNYDHFNNSHINRSFGAFLVFNPKDPSLPPVQIIDRRSQEKWKSIVDGYNSVVQNYRMISNGKRTGWPQTAQIYGAAVIGIDEKGNILFILSRSPYSTHDFINILLALPIDIKNAMYVEGGNEAALYLKTTQKEMYLVGACESDFIEHSEDRFVFSIPNVIGFGKRK